MSFSEISEFFQPTILPSVAIWFSVPFYAFLLERLTPEYASAYESGRRLTVAVIGCIIGAVGFLPLILLIFFALDLFPIGGRTGKAQLAVVAWAWAVPYTVVVHIKAHKHLPWLR